MINRFLFFWVLVLGIPQYLFSECKTIIKDGKLFFQQDNEEEGDSCILKVDDCVNLFIRAIIPDKSAKQVGIYGENLVKCVLIQTGKNPQEEEREYPFKVNAREIMLSIYFSQAKMSFPFTEDTSRIVDFVFDGKVGVEAKNIRDFRADYYEQIAKDYLLLESRNLESYIWFFVNKWSERGLEKYKRMKDKLINFLKDNDKFQTNLDEDSRLEIINQKFAFVFIELIAGPAIKLTIMR